MGISTKDVLLKLGEFFFGKWLKSFYPSFQWTQNCISQLKHASAMVSQNVTKVGSNCVPVEGRDSGDVAREC